MCPGFESLRRYQICIIFIPRVCLHSMLKRIRQFILSEHLIPTRCDTVLVAVSGGIDSCVLLDIFTRIKPEFRFHLIVIHFNHQMRGKASWKDEELVRSLAESYNVRIIVGRTREVPQQRSETGLRKFRMDFFQRVLNRYPGAVLVTGHNLNDQIETFFMRLLKGSHVAGLLGIRPRSGRLIHPLIRESRESIAQYAGQRKLVFREDKTNSDITIIRNRIRHRILPYLRKNLGYEIEKTIVRTLTDLKGYYQIYEQKLAEVVAECTKRTKGVLLLNRKAYAEYSVPLRRGLLEYCISKVYPLNYPVSDYSLQQWDKFITCAQPGRKRAYLHQDIALADRKYIHFGFGNLEDQRKYTLIPGKKLILYNQYSVCISPMNRADVTYSTDRNLEYIDAETGQGKYLVRFWKTGDRFVPLGMNQKKKLSDFFIDLKISSAVKKQIPLVCRGNEIVWVAGYRLDDRFKVAEKTKKTCKLEIKITNKK
jgi:tRNA(Ile)-lysidine synthase